MNENNLFKLLLVLLAVVVIVFLYSFFLGRTPENFSEAWLEETPSTVIQGQDFEFSFVIQNSEGKDLSYDYALKAENQEKKRSFIEISAGEKKLISEKISLNNSSEKSKVLIEVGNPLKKDPFTLWFWVEVKK